MEAIPMEKMVREVKEQTQPHPLVGRHQFCTKEIPTDA